MTWVDWVAVVVVGLSVLTAARKGFFVECFSLAGVIVGLLLASWNYQRLVPYLLEWIQTRAIAQATAFVAIAVGTMLVAGIAGRIVRWVVQSVGLGWADWLLGALFGFMKGCVLVTLGVMAAVAFLPQSPSLQQSRFASYFTSMARQAAVVAPRDLSERVRQGVKLIHEVPQDWMTPPAPGPRQ